jgi:hypothetical protein
MEFVYLDQQDDQGNYFVNPSVPDKVALEHIQDWRVAIMEGDDGNTYQVRGYSGWYFQASSSTSEVEVNDTANDEMDVTQGRTDWRDLIMWWANKPTGYSDPTLPGVYYPKFYGIERLFMGLTEFGGHYFVSGGYNPPPPSPPGRIVFDRYAGPIRTSYLYGPHAISTIYHTMKFELLSKCAVTLSGKTPTILNWGALGSIIPSGNKVKLQPGSDTLIVMDGQRGIRIRTNGWHAHFGDHIFKNSVTREYRWGGNIEWVVATGFVPVLDEPIQGTPLSSYDPDAGITSYGSTIQFAGYHHWHLEQWSDMNPGKMDRYNIQGKATIWYKRPDPPYPNAWSNPDPYKVIKGAYDLPAADEVSYSQATVFETMHEAPDPLFNVEASYAKSIGISFGFTQSSDKWWYIHVEWYSNDTLIGSKFLSFEKFGDYNLILWKEKIPWKPGVAGGGSWTGGYPGQGEFIPDDAEAGDPEFANEANMLCLPFGTRTPSILPTCGITITSIGSSGVPYTFVPHSELPKVGLGGGSIVRTVTLNWGDGTADACLLDQPIQHQWDSEGYYTISMEVTYTEASGRGPDRSKTYIRVAP